MLSNTEETEFNYNTLILYYCRRDLYLCFVFPPLNNDRKLFGILRERLKKYVVQSM